jgi:hypothetical protein
MFWAIIETQSGRCVICQTALSHEQGKRTSPHVDHDHTTGKVRGILCGNCNIALGAAKDDPIILAAMITYLAA